MRLVNPKRPTSSGLTLSISYPSSIQEPVSLDYMKRWLRVDFDMDDDIIEGLITETRTMLEGQFSVAIIDGQTVTFTLNEYPEFITFPISPMKAITSITVDGTALTTDDYELIGSGLNAVLRLEGYRKGTLRIVYTAGFGDNLPSDISTAIRQDVATRYDQRDNIDNTSNEFSDSTSRIMRKYENLYYKL